MWNFHAMKWMKCVFWRHLQIRKSLVTYKTKENIENKTIDRK